MHWERLKPPPNLVTWLLVLASLALLSLAAFTLWDRGVGMAVTGVLLFGLAYLSRSDVPAVRR
jgi:hypothetical protein